MDSDEDYEEDQEDPEDSTAHASSDMIPWCDTCYATTHQTKKHSVYIEANKQREQVKFQSNQKPPYKKPFTHKASFAIPILRVDTPRGLSSSSYAEEKSDGIDSSSYEGYRKLPSEVDVYISMASAMDGSKTM